MTTEHVTVPREELDALREELRQRVSPLSDYMSAQVYEWWKKLDDILSRATPSDALQYTDSNGRMWHIKQSAPRVVTDEDVERAASHAFQAHYRGSAYEGMSWLAIHPSDGERWLRSTRAALESLPAVRVPDGWKLWDKNNPPPFGRYVIWDAALKDTTKPLVWDFRPVERFEMGRRWGMKPGSGQWFNEGDWASDRAPSHYHDLPVAPNPNDAKEHGNG